MKKRTASRRNWNDSKQKAFYEDDLSNAVWVNSQAQEYTQAVAEATA